MKLRNLETYEKLSDGAREPFSYLIEFLIFSYFAPQCDASTGNRIEVATP
jgi:hypothetical protein